MSGPSDNVGSVPVASAPPSGADLTARRTKYWLSVGVQVSASSKDVNKATVMVTASARKKLPVTPVMATSGTNTTIGVIVEPMSGTVSSRKALSMAWKRLCPASRCNTMFSRTTMASSMTRPTAAARPPSVIRLKDCPVNFRTMNVMRSVTGITIPATKEVPQSRKKRTRIMDESRIPSNTASRTLEMESWTMVDWS